MAKIFLKRGRANPLWHGHPWVYSGAIAREEGGYEPGDVAEVCDSDGRLIGRGFVNPRSQIRVRMVTRKDEPVDAALIARRLDEAAGLRRRLGLPSERTDAYRLVNSEGDALPGLVVDIYRDVAAVQFTALGMKRLDGVVFDALARREGVRAVVEVAAGGFAQIEGFASASRTVRGPEVTAVPCRENGLDLEVEPLHGQKTGMFLDQRDNRRRLAEFCRGARVLDVYAYAGGFALNALAAGATSATCVDSSARALERIRLHAEKNHLGPLEAHEVDAFRFLEQVTPRSFDVVVIDPPKFARAKKDLEAALKGYERLNALAMNACAPGALLATCSCSQNVDGETFERVIAGAAQAAGRRVQVLEVASQGPDHPVPPAFPEGRYLKFVLCRVV
ncbi:MAG: class I SAM-dependent rRNA methyltransferase [Myxococcales bacterium]|nr:class I SAM-dependent rRNA methyltransferase [Myxococcales bacterium]